MIYFSSDSHFGHKAVLSLCCRPFDDIQAHDQELIRCHNECVAGNDTVYLLGDIGFRCSAEYLASCLSKMKGRKHILLGNHDKPLRQAYKSGYLKKLITSGEITIIGGESSIYDKSLATAKMLKVNEQKIFISHYANRSWPGAFRGSWHLYGHSHSNLPPLFKSFDVGVDSETETHTKYYPWSFDEIQKRMDAIPNDFCE